MPQIITSIYKTPIGELLLGSIGDELCLCDWKYRHMRTAIDNRIQKGFGAEYQEGESEVIERTITQLDEYFEGERREFDIPLRFMGTDFQQSVWQELMRIGYGSTLSYLELSEKLGNKKAIRAVASANGANATSIIVPCHRIIGSDGELVGYAGGLRAKKKLLELEGALSQDGQLDLFG